MTLDVLNKTGSTTPRSATTASKNPKTQLFQWMVKWYYANSIEDTSTKPDLPSIICILQAIGFNIRHFDKKDDANYKQEAAKIGSIKISMECGTSKMTAELEMDDVACECPDNSDAKEGSLWSITGTVGMEGNKKIEETGSNLLPEMGKATKHVVQDVIHRLIKIINNKSDEICPDIEANRKLFSPPVNSTQSNGSKKKEGIVRSYTDFFTTSNKESHKKSTSNETNLVKSKATPTTQNAEESGAPHKLKRQGTYDVLEDGELSVDEPRSPPAPRVMASSPVQLEQLCSSIGQLSLQSDEEINGLADYVIKAHQILDMAVNYIMKKLPLNSSLSTSQEDNITVTKSSGAAPVNSSSSQTKLSPRNGTAATSGSGSISSSGMSSQPSSRSSSNSSLSRLSSTCSQQMPPPTMRPSPLQRQNSRSSIPRPGSVPNQRASTGSALNQVGTPSTPMRDRSSSLSSAQRPNLGKPVVPPAGPVRGKSSLAINTAGLAQRTTPTGMKPPGFSNGSKLNQSTRLSLVSNTSASNTSTNSNTSLTERSTTFLLKRRSPSSVGAKIGKSTVKTIQSKPSGNTSLTRPSSQLNTSVSSVSKFGFAGSIAKK